MAIDVRADDRDDQGLTRNAALADTIFALSSGPPPSGIAVIRVSGPRAGEALRALAGTLPTPRHAAYRRFRDADGAPLDDGLALWFPGPGSATGEDLAELHLHGGRAVVAAALAALGALGLRPAVAGEFTRRALDNGRIDLGQAEGLADLLAAETESQRQSALALAEGALGLKVAAWQAAILKAAALVEAELDFADEGDVAEGDEGYALGVLVAELRVMLAAPPAERLRDGVRVVLAGPPNAGKSSLFNELIGREAAIVTDIAGTTRDRIEAPVSLDGVPLLFIDTAGLHDERRDPVEALGIERTTEAMTRADIVLWLGRPADAPDDAMIVAAKSDLASGRDGLPVSVVTGEGIAELRVAIVDRAKALLPRPGTLALNARHRAIISEVCGELAAAEDCRDLILKAEHLRASRAALDRLTGAAGTEAMLDALFSGFCIGK